MSLLPILFSDYWDEIERPRSFLDQYCGLTSKPGHFFESLHTPRDSDIILFRPIRGKFAKRYQPYDQTNESKTDSKGASVVKADKDKFHVTLDVQQFLPEEISVKVVDNTVLVEGKHEEKQDEHGWISRRFLRKYLVPSQSDVDQVRSKLSLDGILTITAPRKPIAAVQNRERVIKIQQTGKPMIRDNKTPRQPAEGDKRKDLQPDAEEKNIAAA